jgi:hypothetical protein
MLSLFRKATAAMAPLGDCGNLPSLAGRSFRMKERILLTPWMVLAVGCALGFWTLPTKAASQFQLPSNPARSPTADQTRERTPPNEDLSPSPPETTKLKQQRLKLSFQKMERDADDLAALAKSLQEELHKSNQNVLSLKVLSKAEQIEKLAKKIKTSARGY